MIYALYALTLMFSIFAVSGINFNQIIKRNAKWEALCLQVLLALALSYTSTHLLLDIIEAINK